MHYKITVEIELVGELADSYNGDDSNLINWIKSYFYQKRLPARDEVDALKTDLEVVEISFLDRCFLNNP